MPGCVVNDCCAVLTANVALFEVTLEDQVLLAQDFLEQPKEGFFSLLILIRRSVTDTKRKIPLGDDSSNLDPKARPFVASSCLYTFKFVFYVKRNSTSSSSLPIFLKGFVTIRCGLPAMQAFPLSFGDSYDNITLRLDTGLQFLLFVH